MAVLFDTLLASVGVAFWLTTARVMLRRYPKARDIILQATVISACLTLIIPWVLVAAPASRLPYIVHFGGFFLLGSFLAFSEFVRMRLRTREPARLAGEVRRELCQAFYFASNLW